MGVSISFHAMCCDRLLKNNFSTLLVNYQYLKPSRTNSATSSVLSIDRHDIKTTAQQARRKYPWFYFSGELTVSFSLQADSLGQKKAAEVVHTHAI
jgi:hypothetical protein